MSVVVTCSPVIMNTVLGCFSQTWPIGRSLSFCHRLTVSFFFTFVGSLLNTYKRILNADALLNKYAPAKSLQTSNNDSLVVLKTRLKMYESAFSHFGPNEFYSLLFCEKRLWKHFVKGAI